MNTYLFADSNRDFILGNQLKNVPRLQFYVDGSLDKTLVLVVHHYFTVIPCCFNS